jgi:isopentenyldiphosphate isomerase
MTKELNSAAREFGRPEFLRCVNLRGEVVYAAESIIKDFRETAAQHPEFGLWFQSVTIREKDEDKQLLLIARWLCHLAGFRHTSIHLFIEHPELKDYLFVQVRAVDKPESPACFDLPVAGHIVGTDSAKESLFKELQDEINLTPDDIADLEMLDCYDYDEEPKKASFQNVEFRMVFRSRLKNDSLLKIKFNDHEVAAICMFSIAELQDMINRFPERIASGLKKSFPIYLRAKRKVLFAEAKKRRQPIQLPHDDLVTTVDVVA